MIGVERGFALEDGTLTYLDELWTDSSMRMNEGGCDPDGRFYCGSTTYDKQPGAVSAYRLEPDGSVRVVAERLTISNGIDWSPDGALAYYNDTETHRTDVVDYDHESGFSGRRPFVETPDLCPDGRRPLLLARAGFGLPESRAGSPTGTKRPYARRRPPRGAGPCSALIGPARLITARTCLLLTLGRSSRVAQSRRAHARCHSSPQPAQASSSRLGGQ